MYLGDMAKGTKAPARDSKEADIRALRERDGRGDTNFAFLRTSRAEGSESWEETDVQVGNVADLPGGLEDRLAGRVLAGLRKSGEGILEAGRALAEAKAKLPHGRYGPWLDEKVGISRSWASKFRAIGEADFLANVADQKHLPASVDTLYRLARLDGYGREKVKDHIHPGLTSREVKEIVNPAPEEEVESGPDWGFRMLAALKEGLMGMEVGDEHVGGVEWDKRRLTIELTNGIVVSVKAGEKG